MNKGKCILKQLPSGFWAIWIDGNWIEASCKDKNAAYLKAFSLGLDVVAAFRYTQPAPVIAE